MIKDQNKRIAKNTLMLYIRQILITVVNFYTIRVVLNTLGVEDYGVYNVIAGIVLLLAFLRGTMASATQRFFSFALGKKDLTRLKKIFTVNFLIYVIIAFIAFIFLETIGVWFVKNHLSIPLSRVNSAIFVFHFSIFSFIATIFSTPFIAIIIAHEDMKLYAYISILEAFLKLGIVFLLINMNGDKLEMYGVLVFIVSLVMALLYIIICSLRYIECQFKKFYFDTEIMLEIVSFTGWTLFGQVTTVARTEAITVLLNQMFNPVVVAGRAIASSVARQINIFSNNFNIGLYPPIVKYYASDNKKEMFNLIFNGSKITFFLMWVFALPLFLEMDIILQLWLKEPPPEAVLFTRLALVEVLINSISLPITTAARAPGKMKTYELTLGSIQILIFVVVFLVLKAGAPSFTVYIVAIIANIIMFFVRLFITKGLINLSIFSFIKQVLFPVFIIAMLSLIPSFALQVFLPRGLLYSALIIFFSLCFSSIAMYFIGFDRDYRKYVFTSMLKKIGIYK